MLLLVISGTISIFSARDLLFMVISGSIFIFSASDLLFMVISGSISVFIARNLLFMVTSGSIFFSDLLIPKLPIHPTIILNIHQTMTISC